MAAAALNTTKVIAYDAIVLDRELPYRDGLEVLGELRQSTALAHQSALYLSMDRSKPVLYDCEPGFLGMANMSSPKDSARQPTSLYEMMQRLGIEPGEDVVPRLSLAYMTAFRRCQTCPTKEACREWLDTMPQSVAAAPSFCPNDDILFELRINQPGHASVVVDQHACIADLERFVDEIDELVLQKADDDPLVAELKSRKVHLYDEIEWLRRKPHLDV